VGKNYPYYAFTGKSRLDKAINSLLGIIEGIAADSIIDEKESRFLSDWVKENQDLELKHPFDELMPLISRALQAGSLTTDEMLDLKWLCENLRSIEYYDQVAADMQRLQGILEGIIADSQISEAELRHLSVWLSEHGYLKSCWPYDEIDSIIAAVLGDGKIDESEQAALLSFFSEFTGSKGNPSSLSAEAIQVTAVCAMCPEIVFRDSTFCFTGESSKLSRSEFHETVKKLGGKPREAVSKRLNYLVIGANGNPCWKYACYGRKVEEAMNLRREGYRIVIVHENDFHDAVLDKTS
jgi:hypothetical protein